MSESCSQQSMFSLFPNIILSLPLKLILKLKFLFLPNRNQNSYLQNWYRHYETPVSYTLPSESWFLLFSIWTFCKSIRFPCLISPSVKWRKHYFSVYRAIRINAPKVCGAFRFCSNNAHTDEVHPVFSFTEKPSSAVLVPGYFTAQFTVPPLQLILKIKSKLNVQSHSG